mmetsp:Transcript_4786/g.8082  ORF Transcript_4786/g.8082 Transcript_4786/m.8082 type:complete len:241 (-) Transcript_4786:4-726(-)
MHNFRSVVHSNDCRIVAVSNWVQLTSSALGSVRCSFVSTSSKVQVSPSASTPANSSSLANGRRPTITMSVRDVSVAVTSIFFVPGSTLTVSSTLLAVCTHVTTGKQVGQTHLPTHCLNTAPPEPGRVQNVRVHDNGPHSPQQTCCDGEDGGTDGATRGGEQGGIDCGVNGGSIGMGADGDRDGGVSGGGNEGGMKGNEESGVPGDVEGGMAGGMEGGVDGRVEGGTVISKYAGLKPGTCE